MYIVVKRIFFFGDETFMADNCSSWSGDLGLRRLRVGVDVDENDGVDVRTDFMGLRF